jgi:hypothetical protein
VEIDAITGSVAKDPRLLGFLTSSGGAGATMAVPDRGHAYARFEFWVAAFTAIVTLLTLIMAVAAPPKAGPFCVEGCVEYPYNDVAACIPRDFLWMYPALLVAPLFMVLTSVIQEQALPNLRRFSRLAVAFATMAATLLTADYFIQLRVIQPAILQSEFEGLAPLTQYNPHGVFIALEEAGYLAMAVAFLFSGLSFAARDRLDTALRWIFIAGFVLVVLLLGGLSAAYGLGVEYRFEVAAISVDWTVLIVGGTLLAVSARRTA